MQRSVQSRQETDSEPDCSGLSFCGGSGIAAAAAPGGARPASCHWHWQAPRLPAACRSHDRSMVTQITPMACLHAGASGRARPAVSTARAPGPGPASFYTVPCSAALLKPGNLNL